MTDDPQSEIQNLKSKIRLGAIILAGGQSRRMGTDKAELRLPAPDGKRVISYVIDALAEVVAKQDIIIVGEGRAALGIHTIPDVVSGQGPLVGLYSGLRETQRDWNFVVACDLPLLQPSLLRGLSALISDDYDAIVPQLDKAQTACALYHRCVLPALERLLADDVRRMSDLLTAIRVRAVGDKELRGWDSDLRSFVNLNTTEDYQRVGEMMPRLQAKSGA